MAVACAAVKRVETSIKKLYIYVYIYMLFTICTPSASDASYWSISFLVPQRHFVFWGAAVLPVHIWGLQDAQTWLQGCGKAAGVFSSGANTRLFVNGNGLPAFCFNIYTIPVFNFSLTGDNFCSPLHHLKMSPGGTPSHKTAQISWICKLFWEQDLGYLSSIYIFNVEIICFFF